MQRVEVRLGNARHFSGLYGMRPFLKSWACVGVTWIWKTTPLTLPSSYPFKVPPKTKVIEEMAPPNPTAGSYPLPSLPVRSSSNQFAMQEAQREQAEKDGKPYYDNDLVVAKPDGAPISAAWVSSQFGKLLEDLNMPHIRFHDLRHTAATNMHQLTGDFYTVGEILGHTLAGIGVSLGLSMNFEAVTARYVDVRLERQKGVLDAYHGAVKQADPAKAEKAEPKKAKSAAKKKAAI